MYESYIKEVPIIDLNKEESESEILKSIVDSQKKLELAHKNFEYARGDLVDYYAYQIKSEQSKMDYLIKQAKDKKIELDKINNKK